MRRDVSASAPRKEVSVTGLKEASASVVPGLLALARQASAVAFALLGGCAPGVRKGRRLPQGAAGAVEVGAQRIEGATEMEIGQVDVEPVRGQDRSTASVPDSDALIDRETVASAGDGEQVDRDGETKAEGPQILTGDNDTDNGLGEALSDSDSDAGTQLEESKLPGAQKTSENDNFGVVPDEEVAEAEKTESDLPIPQVQTCDNVDAAPDSEPLLSPPSASSLIAADPFVNLTETTDIELPAPIIAPRVLEHPAGPHAKLRADLVRKVAAFTAARLTRCVAPVPAPLLMAALIASPPLRRTAFDDPFVDCPATPRAAPFVPAHPLALHYPSLQFRPDQQQSPTPQPRVGRPPLRQQTVFFKQVQPSTAHKLKRPSPELWAPHPAGKRSCAIVIKAPRDAEDKENRGVA
ncbi:hypothetical protein DFH09DRAFT_1133752 [Mycena vulgaris]|nr:hypothetical protein DFH09DRAFT_1133752 [Mycena vulgaris]